MGMGWHTLAVPERTNFKESPCKCGKGKIITCDVIEEESEYPPFERGYSETKTTCPDNCENVRQ